MDNQPLAARSERARASSKYSIARANLLAVLLFSVINIITVSANLDFYMLFSAQVPLISVATGQYLTAETGVPMYLIVSIVLAVLMLIPYLLCWIFSKKHYGWMIAALVIFSLDCVALILNFDVSLIIDILFHIWVMYYLVIGVIYGGKLKKLPEEELTVPQPQETDSEGNALPKAPDTPVLRAADTEAKCKVYLQTDVYGHHIIYRKIGKCEELVVDGMVYAEFVRRGMALTAMTAVVDGMRIAAGFEQSRNYIIVNDLVVAQNTRWV